MSKAKDVLNSIDNLEEGIMTVTAVDQTKLLQAYKRVYNNFKELKDYADKFLEMFPEPMQLAKEDKTKNVGKYLFMATKDGTAKITNIFDIDKDLYDITNSVYSLESKLDRQSDNIGS